MEILANQYFDGVISREDEHTLLAFVNADAANRQLFGEWEDCWTKDHIVSDEVQEAWRKLYNTLSDKEEGLDRSIRNRARAVRFSVAAAAAAVLVLLTSVLTLKLSAVPESYNVCIAPAGSTSQIVLPDGSKVWLNAGSTLRYSNRFNNKHREVELKGEALFDVTKRGGMEFIVKTLGYDVVVKGTKFNVSAYPDDRLVTTALLEGRVTIHRQAAQLEMMPGETVTYNKETGEISKQQSKKTPGMWTMDVTECDNITLDDLSKILSRKYNVTIHIDNPRLREERFVVSLHNGETIDEVLEALQKTTLLYIDRKGREIHLR